MKKLLLLAALPLLIGCGVETQEKDFGWKVLKQNEYLEVKYGNTSKNYFANGDIEVKYQFTIYNSVAEVRVEQNYSNGQKLSDYYIGTNITVYHYEV